MRALSYITAIVGVAAAIALPIRAEAGLHFCNTTKYAVFVAIAIYPKGDLPVAGSTNASLSRVDGWWKIAPGKCTTPIGKPLDASVYGPSRQPNYEYLYFAVTEDGSFHWGGDTSDDKEGTRHYCVLLSGPFGFWDQGHDSDDGPVTCATGASRHFHTIDAYRKTDVTTNLTL